MSTPDAAAAAPTQHVPLHELTHEHVGAVVTFADTTGVLTDLPTPVELSDLLAVPIREHGKPYTTVETGAPEAAIEVVHAAPPSPYDDKANAEAKTPEHIVVAREMAEIQDSIDAKEGEVVGLKARYAELERKIMDYYELAGADQVAFDDRLAFLKSRTFPQYRERPASAGGGNYSAKDAVEVLRAIGREGDIKPETVNHQTLGAILREYRDSNKPVPPELEAIVTLGETYSVRIGAPGRRRR